MEEEEVEEAEEEEQEEKGGRGEGSNSGGIFIRERSKRMFFLCSLEEHCRIGRINGSWIYDLKGSAVKVGNF
ncbi:hypothetical protein M0802_013199 [Mischocyttarus mexicanus]|nr:hypothetical protein M0802_013199 [Mischocyttarus mexicanus]